MNLFELANIAPRRGITIDRLERLKREGSPVYTWTPGAINAGESLTIEVGREFPAARKYAPLDSLEIASSESANALTLTINGGDSRPVPAGTIRSIAGSGVALWTITLTNNGVAATTAGKIIVSLQKEPLTIDKWAQNQ